MTEQDDETDEVIRGRASVLMYADKHGMKDKDIRKHLLALHPDNDPFYIPQRWQEKHAVWFAEVFKQRAEETGDDEVNPRGEHYYAYAKNLMDWDGEPYLNENKWTKRTTDASKFARYMGLIDYDAIVDAKNPPPQIHRRYGRLKYNIDTDTDDKEIELPNIKYADGIYCKIDIDRWVRSEADKYKEIITADMGVFPDDLQPYHTELFIEKTDHDRILDPICAKYLTNYQAFKGEGSLKAVTLLMERIEHVNKPVLIFYISDFDGKGEHMPTAFARKIEFLVRSKGVDKDIKLKPIALLPWQVKEYKLPRRPIKDGDKSKKKFEKKHGKGAVELDALEGICPGEFKKSWKMHLNRISTKI